MAVTSTTAKVTYTGNGTTATYAYTFKIFAATDLQVTETVIATGVQTVLTYTTHYSVTGVGVAGGGNVVLVAGNLPATKKLTLFLNPPLTQVLDLEESDDFLEQNFEDALDKLTKQNQSQQDQIDRSLKADITSTTTLTLPAASTGKAIKWAAGGTFTNTTYDPDDQVTLAAAQVSLATTQANNAASSASTATTQAGIATAQAALAAGSAVAAAASAATIDFTKDDSADLGGATASDSKVPSQHAVKTYVDTYKGIIQALTAVDETERTSVAVIPNDNTIPQYNEGEATGLSVAITPKKSGNKFIITAQLNISDAADNLVSASIIVNGAGGAIAVSQTKSYQNYAQSLVVMAVYTTTSVSEHTFLVRFGPASIGTAYLNRAGAGSLFGGASISTIKVEEYE